MISHLRISFWYTNSWGIKLTFESDNNDENILPCYPQVNNVKNSWQEDKSHLPTGQNWPAPKTDKVILNMECIFVAKQLKQKKQLVI